MEFAAVLYLSAEFMYFIAESSLSDSKGYFNCGGAGFSGLRPPAGLDSERLS